MSTNVFILIWWIIYFIIIYTPFTCFYFNIIRFSTFSKINSPEKLRSGKILLFKAEPIPEVSYCNSNMVITRLSLGNKLEFGGKRMEYQLVGDTYIVDTWGIIISWIFTINTNTWDAEILNYCCLTIRKFLKYIWFFSHRIRKVF